MPAGSKPGEHRGGRKKGTKNKVNMTRLDTILDEKTMMPHEFLLAVSRGFMIGRHRPTPQERMRAAHQCAPFYASRLESSSVKIEGRLTLDMIVSESYKPGETKLAAGETKPDTKPTSTLKGFGSVFGPIMVPEEEDA